MKIHLGPAGVPISAKGRGSLEGVRRVAELGLNAMEVEFVRGVNMSLALAKEIGKSALEFDVHLSVHAPYYINLASSDRSIVSASKKRILDSFERAHAMGADIVVVHAAYRGGMEEGALFGKLRSECAEIVAKCEKEDWVPMLGLETMARPSQWGTLDEVVTMCKVVGAAPLIDWAHIFARNGGIIDYAATLDKVAGRVHSHFSNMRNVKGKFVDIHEPINGHPPFEPLAKEIIKRKRDITIICESPLLEQDALKMKAVFEKLGYKF